MPETILEHWDLSDSELTQIVDNNPSLRGFLFGYVAEYKLRKLLFSDSRTSNVFKADDHDRSKKNDLTIT